MAKDSVVLSEFDNILKSLRKIGIAIYLQMLQCPNLKDLEKELIDLSDSEENFETISDKIILTCNYFVCNKREQKFRCDDGNCRYTNDLERNLAKTCSKLTSFSQELIT